MNHSFRSCTTTNRSTTQRSRLINSSIMVITCLASLLVSGMFNSETSQQTVMAQTLKQKNGKQTNKSQDNAGIPERKLRRTDALKNGATKQSEKAVDAALKWLAEHQQEDGRWNFDHTGSTCMDRCDHPGTYKSSANVATAMALLPFLGAGQSHMEGKYKANIAKGLKYLLTHAKVKGKTASWFESVGNHYSHGIVVIALCEAYAMTHLSKKKNMSREEKAEYKKLIKVRKQQERENKFSNKKLKKAAQMGLNYIMQVQYSDGGWRYFPPRKNSQSRGDTSVVSWMFTALKTGHRARLKVSKRTLQGAIKYLDAVKHNEFGSEFKYMHDSGHRRPNKATTAIGLLIRMDTTWSKKSPALMDGVKRVGNWGFNASNLYYNYYATQVLFHFGGKDWNRWNTTMRDHLIKSQSSDGHSTGSWFFKGGHGATNGGRLYNTVLATLILEVYYRSPPIYERDDPKKKGTTLVD